VKAMRAAHVNAGTTLTIALREMPDCSRYGEAVFDANCRITEFIYPGRAKKGWISTGVYVVSPEIFSGFKLPEAFSFESDFQRPYLAQVKPCAWESSGYFIDIGVPDDYAKLQKDIIFLKKEKRSNG
jgi:D-glycero-alpha-D-manno-heptose 1-phosphate guanylyltransferase